jgi:hypothetical protein
MKIRLVIVVGAILVLFACEEKTTWEIPSEPLNTIVVEAIITNEYKQQVVILSKPFSDVNGEPVAVSGAAITISDDNNTLNFIESVDQPGTYLGENPAGASINKTYVLDINYAGETYSAEAYMVPVIPSWPLQVIAAGNNLREIEWTAPGYDPDDLAMYEVTISWSHLVDTTFSDTLTEARMLHYTLNTIDVSHIVFPQEKEEVFFPQGSILIAKKYSVTEDYAAFLRALLAETDWQGSLFEDARGNLPTNISNGGLGYFSVCSVVSDTIVVE